MLFGKWCRVGSRGTKPSPKIAAVIGCDLGGLAALSHGLDDGK